MDFKYLKKWQIALLIFAAYNLIVLINFPSLYVSILQSPQPADLWRSYARLAIGNNLWALITPFILWLGWIFPVAKPNFTRNLFLHFLFALGVGAIHHGANSIFNWSLGLSRADSLQGDLFNVIPLLRFMTGALVHYPVVIISQRAYLYFRESRERAALLQQAELSALQAQLHPHFFFNTLNALSALIYRSPKEADRMITQLGDLFRVLLKKNKEQEVSLAEELEFLEDYLTIHQTLMGDRLQVVWKIAPETLDSKVPNLILQPLVENSIKYGLAPLEEGGILEIGSTYVRGHLRLEVKDSGVGIKDTNKTESDNGIGIGIENTRARLFHLYGDTHRFELVENPGGGLSVVIEIPLQENYF